eukprot:366524-Chlamydomonas_euryale.AAC.5
MPCGPVWSAHLFGISTGLGTACVLARVGRSWLQIDVEARAGGNRSSPWMLPSLDVLGHKTLGTHALALCGVHALATPDARAVAGRMNQGTTRGD